MKDRAWFLDTAKSLTYGERNRQHGNVWTNFGWIADAWSGFTGREVKRSEVALLMALMKIARTRSGSHNPDDYTDGTAYMAIAGELAEWENKTPELFKV